MTIEFVQKTVIPAIILGVPTILLLWCCISLWLGVRKQKKNIEQNESAVGRDRRWDDARANAVVEKGREGSVIKTTTTFDVGGLKVTEITLTEEAQQKLCIGEAAAEGFRKAPLSEFVGSMKYFAEQSVKQPKNGTVTAMTKNRGWSDYETTRAPRPSWPQVWMDMASIVASRSYDPRLQVGCVVIPADNTGILSLGYNGNARGLPNEPESIEPGCSGFIHAEANALIKCDYNYPKAKHLYVTHSPCRACAKLIIQGGIARVVYKEMYRDDSSIKLMQDAGIEVLSYDEALITSQT